MSRYVGLWYGGSSYSSPYWDADAEVFESLEHARTVLADRYAIGYVLHPSNVPHLCVWQDDGTNTETYRPTIGRKGDNLMCPAVSREDSYIILAPFGQDLDSLEREGEYGGTHLLTIGPRGGVRTERL